MWNGRYLWNIDIYTCTSEYRESLYSLVRIRVCSSSPSWNLYLKSCYTHTWICIWVNVYINVCIYTIGTLARVPGRFNDFARLFVLARETPNAMSNNLTLVYLIFMSHTAFIYASAFLTDFHIISNLFESPNFPFDPITVILVVIQFHATFIISLIKVGPDYITSRIFSVRKCWKKKLKICWIKKRVVNLFSKWMK